VTVAKQIQRSPLPSASAMGIGRSYPMGATVIEGGVNFSLFSRAATGVELLLFPVIPKKYDRDAAKQGGNNAATAMKSVVVDPIAYDWEGDLPLSRPSSRTYENGSFCFPFRSIFSQGVTVPRHARATRPRGR
jgi:pullulanase/glycogen debranching enzyme